MSKRKFESDDVEVPVKRQRIFVPDQNMQVEGRKPKPEWFAGLSKEKQAEWVNKQLTKKPAAKKRKRQAKKYTAQKKGRYGSYGGGGNGTNIIYPNVVGRGRYYIGGSLGYDSEKGWQGGAKAYYTDEDTVQGLGGYSVRKNSLMSSVDLGQDPPRVMNTNHGEATIINHREYLGDLFSGDGEPSNFSLQKYELNPGNSSLFPFLSMIAKQFQEYEVRGMLVELKSLSSEYASNLSLGSVFMAADYNVYGNDPATKQQLENMEYASSAKPSKSMIMPIECDPSNNMVVHKNVAIDNEYHTGDKRLYDWCNVFIGSQGTPVQHTPLAEIWLTYEIALFKPIISGNDHHHSTGAWDSAIWQTVNVTSAHPAGNLAVPNATNSPGFGIRYTGESDPYSAPIVDLPDMQAGHAPVYIKVEYVISQGAVTAVPTVLDTPTITTNGAIEYVTGKFPNAGMASVSDMFVTAQNIGDLELKTTFTCILKRTGANTGGGKSEASLGFNTGTLGTAAKSRGLLTITTFPGTFTP